MTDEIAQEWVLHCTEKGADKLYRVQVVGQGSYGVRADSCRRGGAWNDQGWKAQGLAEMAAAITHAESLVKKKMKGGYHIIENKAPMAGQALITVERNDSGFRPQLLNVIDEDRVEELLDDDAWLMQEKHDGHRRAISQDDSRIVGINKLGETLGVSEGLAQSARRLFCGDGAPFPFLIDGELVGDRLFVFDVLQIRDGKAGDLRDMAYSDRAKRLMLFADINKAALDCLSIVETYAGREAKRAAFQRLKEENAEGVVFKKASAPYSPGRPNSGGDHLKYKFYATATFIVLGVKTGKRSVSLGLLDTTGVPVEMGFCTIPANHAVPIDGALVEVRYLYAYPNGGKVYQPIYLGQRDDVRREDCQLAQLKFKSSTTDLDQD